MRAIQMVLCKTPFTPRYDNVVTGCTSHEFYTKLYNDLNNDVITLKTASTQFRTEFKETDTNLTFAFQLPYSIDLNDYNYIAIKDEAYKHGDQKASFWFLDSFEVLNAMNYVSYTLNCTKDFWHTYCLDLDDTDVFKQNIITKHSKLFNNNEYDYNRPFYCSTSSYPTSKSVLINSRVLWAVVKVNSTYSKSEFNSVVGSNVGFPFDGSITTVYIPLGFLDENDNYLRDNIVSLQVFNYTDYNSNYKLIKLPINKDNVDTEVVQISSNTRIDYDYTIIDPDYINTIGYKERIALIAEHPFVLSASLTFAPPFNFSPRKLSPQFNEYSIDVNIIRRYDDSNINPVVTSSFSVVELNGVYGLTLNRYDGVYYTDVYDAYTDIEYNIPKITDYNSVHTSIPPYRKIFCTIGETLIEIPKPCKKIKIRLFFNASTDGYSASIFVDNELFNYNISSSPSAILPLNSNVASTEMALYGSSYRDAQFIGSSINSLVSSALAIPEAFAPVNAGTKKQRNPTPLEVAKDLNNVGSSLLDVNKKFNDYYASYRTPDNVTNGFVLSSALVYGDYPYIVIEQTLSGYNDAIKFHFKKYGEKVNEYDYITNLSREKFSFIQTDNSILYSSRISQRCNEIVCSMLNNGVHLWNIKNIASLSQIGDYSVQNSEV